MRNMISMTRVVVPAWATWSGWVAPSTVTWDQASQTCYTFCLDKECNKFRPASGVGKPGDVDAGPSTPPAGTLAHDIGELCDAWDDVRDEFARVWIGWATAILTRIGASVPAEDAPEDPEALRGKPGVG